jgi:hypothetical protein
MSHLTFDELMRCADTGSLGAEAQEHVTGCAACQERLTSYRRFEHALRRVPLEHTTAGFTRKVLGQLGISESDSVLWVFLKNLAPFVGLTLISVVLFGILSFFGVFKDSDVGQSVLATRSLYQTAGGAISTGIAQFTVWVGSWLPLKGSPGTLALVIFLLLFFPAVALLDKYLLAPMQRRRMSQ